MTNSIEQTRQATKTKRLAPQELVTLESTVRTQSVDTIGVAAGSAVTSKNSPAVDPLVTVEAPKGPSITKEELETLYQLLAKLGILYKIQMLSFNSSMDTLSVQSTQLRDAAAEAKKYGERAIAIQKKLEKELKEDRDIGNQIVERLPELAMMMMIGYATGGPAGLIAATAAGVLFIALDLKDEKGISAWDKMTKALNGVINDVSVGLGGKKMTPETQRWVNFGIKLGASVAVGAASGAAVTKAIQVSAKAGASAAAQGSKAAATSAAQATARAGTAAARPTGAQSIRVWINSIRSGIQKLKESAKQAATKTKAGKAAARAAGSVKEKMRTPGVRGAAIGIQIAVAALEKWTSIEGVKDPEAEEDNIAVRRETMSKNLVRGANGNPTTAKEMAKADKRGEALETTMTFLLTAIRVAAMAPSFAGPVGAVSKANFYSVENLMLFGGIVSGVANGTEQLVEARKQERIAEWTGELAGVSSKQQVLRGEMQVAQSLQQMLNQDVTAMMTENGQRMQVIWGLLDSLNQTVPSLFQG